MKWYQSCYTNATHMVGDKTSTGWQQVAASDDIPAAASRNCRKYQVAGTSDGCTKMDENGANLNLLEIIGDGTYLYMIRTQYGLFDAHKRSNAFSHAYIFPCKKAEEIRDPNLFLTIANENFARSETEAEKTKKQDTLVQIPAFSVKQALQHCGMNVDTYFRLIQCVYVQLEIDSNIKGALYIQYDGSEMQMRELLYLIYSGLPLYKRRKLAAASCPTGNLKDKHIVFTQKAREKIRYLIPQTGENSISNKENEKNFLKQEYISCFAMQHLENMGDIYMYLEKEAQKLGCIFADDPGILLAVYIMGTTERSENMQEEEMSVLLRNILQSGTVPNEKRTDYILKLMRRLEAREYQLTDKMKSYLTDYAQASGNEELKEIMDKYQIKEAEIAEEPAADKEGYDISETDLSEKKTEILYSDVRQDADEDGREEITEQVSVTEEDDKADQLDSPDSPELDLPDPEDLSEMKLREPECSGLTVQIMYHSAKILDKYVYGKEELLQQIDQIIRNGRGGLKKELAWLLSDKIDEQLNCESMEEMTDSLLKEIRKEETKSKMKKISSSDEAIEMPEEGNEKGIDPDDFMGWSNEEIFLQDDSMGLPDEEAVSADDSTGSPDEEIFSADDSMELPDEENILQNDSIKLQEVESFPHTIPEVPKNKKKGGGFFGKFWSR